MIGSSRFDSAFFAALFPSANGKHASPGDAVYRPVLCRQPHPRRRPTAFSWSMIDRPLIEPPNSH
jgi:hypothetical protein